MVNQHLPSFSTLSVSSCAPALRHEALLHLAAAHDPALQPSLNSALETMANAPERQWEGLWVGHASGKLIGAVWVQPLPMNMAQLWLPLFTLNAVHVNQLLCAAYQWVKASNRRLCYVDTVSQAAEVETQLIKHGMQPLAQLEYLVGRSDQRLGLKTDIPLVLQPFSALSNVEQLALLTAVGHDSLDSCALRDILTVEELRSGFYQQDPQAPKHWYAIHYQESLVGVLLLAPHLALGRWELLLMGLTPEWRGKGFGRALLNKALNLAQQAGVTEIMLAVDGINLPAKRIYQEAGFARYAEQRLFAWKGGGKRCESSE